VKVKQVPSDFVVEEHATIEATDRGRFAVYLLRKRGIGTLEALRAVRRAWRVPARAVGFGGLKDRHADTVQWVTILQGPTRNLEEPAFRLTYEGRSDVPMSRTTLTGNRFRVRLRDLSAAEARRVAERFAAAAVHGIPAYFDDQRFGSLRGGGGFAALHLLRGDAESALRALIASPSREDRKAVRERERAIRDAWGRFEVALPRLANTQLRAPVLHLVRRPGDFVGALAQVDREERRLLASAYASAVWNRTVARRVAELVPDEGRLALPGAAGPLVHPKALEAIAPFDGAVLPMPAPSARASDPAWQAALEKTLAEDGLALDRLTLPPELAMDFRATKRAVVFRPRDGEASEPVADDLNRGRWRLDLSFSLDRGLYATVLLKRIAYDVERLPAEDLS
jgi:tRNA pseudouridine13 synthase